MAAERKVPTQDKRDAAQVGRRPYVTPRLRSMALYERAKLACTFDEFNEVWDGSTS